MFVDIDSKSHTMDWHSRRSNTQDDVDSASRRSSGKRKRLLQRSWTVACDNRPHPMAERLPEDSSSITFRSGENNSNVASNVESWMNNCASKTPFSGPDSPLELHVWRCLFIMIYVSSHMMDTCLSLCVVLRRLSIALINYQGPLSTPNTMVL